MESGTLTSGGGAVTQLSDPCGGVVHEFDVSPLDTEAAVLCDLLAPSYGPGRDCSYFTSLKPLDALAAGESIWLSALPKAPSMVMHCYSFCGLKNDGES